MEYDSLFKFLKILELDIIHIIIINKCQDFYCFWTGIIRGQSVVHGGMV